MHLLDESLEYIVYNLPEKLMEIYFFSIALPNTGRYFIRYSYFIVHKSSLVQQFERKFPKY